MVPNNETANNHSKDNKASKKQYTEQADTMKFPSLDFSTEEVNTAAKASKQKNQYTMTTCHLR